MDPQQQKTLLICSTICLLMGEAVTLCAMMLQLLVLKQHHHSQVIEAIFTLDLEIAKQRLQQQERKILRKKIQRKMRKRLKKKARKMWIKYTEKLDNM